MLLVYGFACFIIDFLFFVILMVQANYVEHAQALVAKFRLFCGLFMHFYFLF